MRALLASVAFTAFTAFITLAACNKNQDAPKRDTRSCPTCVIASDQGFVPASLSLAKGAPGSKQGVTFTRTTNETCATEVVFPDLNIKQDLPLNQPVTVQVPTEAARTLTFQCGMGMYKSALVVK